eukprot:scaffold154374_cov35-Prasinocladus_malaysianus.AAC.1
MRREAAQGRVDHSNCSPRCSEAITARDAMLHSAELSPAEYGGTRPLKLKFSQLLSAMHS